MKTWLQITFLILWSGACFAFGYLAKKTPTPIVIKPAQTVTLNAGENKRLQEQHSKDSLTIIRLNLKIDSLNKPKKNETKITVIDTCIPAVLRQWADYQANE